MAFAEGIMKGLDIGTELALKKFDMDMAQSNFNAKMAMEKQQWDDQVKETKRQNLIKEIEQNAQTPGLGQEYLKGLNDQLMAQGHPGLPMITNPLPEGVQGPVQPEFYSPRSPEDELRAKLKVESEFKDNKLTGAAGNLATILGRTPTLEELKKFGENEANPYYTPIQTSTGLMIFNNRNSTLTPAQIDGKQVLPISADPELAGKMETSKETAKLAAEKKAALPKVIAKYRSSKRDFKNVHRTVDRAIENITSATAGYGALIKEWPATAQNQLNEDLKTIKANVLLLKISQLKDLSPTGATGFGPLSDYEGDTIKATIGSLEQKQKADILIDNLKNIKQYWQDLENDTDTIMNLEYGDIMKDSKVNDEKSSKPKFKIISVE